MYPKITIVTPSYNQAAFLEQTILSVLDQNYPNLEYIMMDGGSTDGSIDIIKKYAPHFTYWVSEKDKGQSDAIDRGFKMATGDIMGWLNSDDFFAKDALWTIAKTFQNNPSVKIISGGIKVYEQGISDDILQFKRPTFENLRYNGNTFFQAATFWRSDFYRANNLSINKQLHYLMDYELWLRMSFCMKPSELLYTDEHLANLNYHENQKITIQNLQAIAIESNSVRLPLLAKHRLLFKSFIFLMKKRLTKKGIGQKIPTQGDMAPLLYLLKWK